ncbi:helix-turn-helix domain-containing protein [Streptomyces sp. NPDC018019]|uniref:helix-turn-helix domain-containing protein n=1 Tax=Streptomyces sp. NPDC018019 TaxID=3365030 RepID=UPI0037B6C71F
MDHSDFPTGHLRHERVSQRPMRKDWSAMDSTAAKADGPISLDTTATPRECDAAPHGRERQTGGFRATARAARVRGAAIIDVADESAIRTVGTAGGMADQIRLYVVRCGAWRGGVHDRDERTVASGQFLLRYIGRPSHFRTAPHTSGNTVALPAVLCAPLLGDQGTAGPADPARVRLLVARANSVHETVTGLGPAAVQAAHSILIELAKATMMRRLDDVETQLALLAQTARNLTDSRLPDPELSPATLARGLNVSIRTLQRAFAVSGESVASYIRRRRLEEARLALTTPTCRRSISELAAHWQFADSSHFIRAFKKQYGQTPREYARSHKAGDRYP